MTGSVMTNTTLWIATLMVETAVWKTQMGTLFHQKSFALTAFGCNINEIQTEANSICSSRERGGILTGGWIGEATKV